MRVTEIHFSKTVQVRRYEPERFEMTITLNEGESVQEAMRRARLTAARELGLLDAAEANDDGAFE